MSGFERCLTECSKERRSCILCDLPSYLAFSNELGKLYTLMTNIFFLEAKIREVSVFDLAADLARSVSAMPAKDPYRRVLCLLEEAVRRDIHFIDRHLDDYPQALFQCIWNSCWWYNRPGLGNYYYSSNNDSSRIPRHSGGSILHRLMEFWRTQKERSLGKFYWIRSLRPPHVRLGTANSKVLRGSGNVIYDVFFSKKSSHIITAEGQLIHLWDLVSGIILADIDTQDWDSRSIACTPDSQEIAVAGSDGSVHIFDIQSWRETRHFNMCDEPLHSVVYSQCGYHLAAAGLREMRVINTKDLSELIHIKTERNVQQRREFISAIAVSPDSCQIAVAFAGLDMSVQFFDINNAKKLHHIRMFAWPNCLEYSPDGKKIAVNYAAPRMGDSPPQWGIQVLEAVSGALLFTLTPHKKPVKSVAYSFDGKLIATGSEDGIVRLWNAETGSQLSALHGHTDEIMCLAFSQDTTLLASGSSDGAVFLWDLSIKEQTTLHRIGDDDHLVSVSFSSDGSRIVTGSLGYDKINIWKTKDGICTQCHLQEDDGGSENVVFSPDDTKIIGPNFDTIKIWDACNGYHILTIKPQIDVLSINKIRCFRNSSRIVATITTEEMKDKVIVWNAENGNEILMIDPGIPSLSDFALSPDETQLFVVSPQRSIFVYDIDTGGKVMTMEFPEHISDIEFFPSDAAYVTGGDHSMRTQIWDRENGQLLWQINASVDLKAVANGLPFLTNGEKGETVFFEQATGKQIAWFNDRIEHISTHRDGNIWAGISGLYLQIVKLEGRESVKRLAKPRRNYYWGKKGARHDF